jgi:hypothetical protein
LAWLKDGKYNGKKPSKKPGINEGPADPLIISKVV